MSLAANIQDQMKKNKYTLDELSEYSGVPVGTLRAVVYGRTPNPKIDTLSAIVNAFQCEYEDLLPPLPYIQKYTNQTLHRDCLIKVEDIARKNSIDLRKDKALRNKVVDELYKHIEEHDNKTIDSNFVLWLLNHMMSSAV